MLRSPYRQDIREQDPLKQGLKPDDDSFTPRVYTIREQDPLKQGLKLLENIIYV